jgi:hypothetical protein
MPFKFLVGAVVETNFFAPICIVGTDSVDILVIFLNLLFTMSTLSVLKLDICTKLFLTLDIHLPMVFLLQ